MVVDRTQFRSFLLIWHLKSWSLRNRNGEKVELEFDEDGSLAEATLGRLNKALSSMLDVVLTLLERELLIS